jgi:hypothetical protein
MPMRQERVRARARAQLQTETPAPLDDGTLLKIQEEAAAIIREAKGRSPSSSELVASAIDDVSRSYYKYLLDRRCRGPKPPQDGQ